MVLLSVCPGEAGRPLNDLSSRPAPGSGGYALDHNLNLTQGPRPGAAPRPPSLPLPSPHTRPDPSEVDDEAPPAPPAPTSSDSNTRLPVSPDDDDPDVINGNLQRSSTFDPEAKGRSAQRIVAAVNTYVGFCDL